MIARYTRPGASPRSGPDQHRFDTWLRVELAACEAMEAARSVPAGTAARRAAKAAGKLDPTRILEHEERTRHDVIAFLTHVEELAGEPARWLHLGMTSSDVLDAALAIQLVAATSEILAGVDLPARRLPAAAPSEHRADALPSAARTAFTPEPITAGLVFAPASYAEVGPRARARSSRRATEIAVGKIAGAVGTYANLDPAVESARAGGPRPSPRAVPTQIERLARVSDAADYVVVTEKDAVKLRGRWPREAARAARGRAHGPVGAQRAAARADARRGAASAARVPTHSQSRGI